MHNLRKYIRVVSVFLLINFLFSTFLPTISYALTSGPTAPEATSFEPIDTTDMVNIQSGGLVYNVPLFEVPGPSGGFPINAFYHSGIQPHQEASWLGLGWNLNVGALNRTVNGLPDDYLHQQFTDREFWKGRTSQSYQIGVSVPQAGFSTSVGFNHDTYQGFSVSMQRSFDLTKIASNFINKKSQEKNGVDQALSNQISLLGSLNASIGTNGFSSSSNVGFSDPFESMDIDLNSGDGSVSANIGLAGFSSSRKKSGSVSSKEFGFNATIPLPGVHINLGAAYVKYWIDENNSGYAYGSLYDYTGTVMDNKEFDNFLLRNPKNIAQTERKPAEETYGAFKNFDSYTVNAQGVYGSIRPYSFINSILRRSMVDDDDEVTLETNLDEKLPYKKVHFRFEGDLSNKLIDPEIHGLDDDVNTFKNPSGLGVVDDYVPNSKYIKHYTISEIRNGSAENDGLILGRDKDSDVYAGLGNIGGFKIINESGLTYHFSLPVYAKDEYTFNGSQDDNGVWHFSTHGKKSKYAYTWLLVAITGPDFVDRGVLGEFDESDWGYWVSFDYGLWMDDYHWRSPASGFTEDVDMKFKSFSKGAKEIYYLNTIKTKTHVAVFEKDVRTDGKGVVSQRDEAVVGSSSASSGVSYLDEGGYIPTYINEYGYEWYKLYPGTQMNLSNIYLLKSDAYEALGGDALMTLGTKFQTEITGEPGSYFFEGQNVFDVSDAQNQLLANSIRSTSFEQDYSLCPQTENSFDPNFNLYKSQPNLSLPNTKSGKLTLNAIKTKGKAGAELIPKTEFSYELENQKQGFARVYTDEGKVYLDTGGDVPNVGDLLKLSWGDKDFYALVGIETSEGVVRITNFIGEEPNLLYEYFNWEVSKNPCYDPDHYDAWNFFKSDYNPDKNSNKSRYTTQTSSYNVDVWSLRKVHSGLGSAIDIQYSSHKYQNALQRTGTGIPVYSISNDDCSNRVKLKFFNSLSDYELQAGTTINIFLVGRTTYKAEGDDRTLCGSTPLDEVHTWETYEDDVQIYEVGEDYLIVDFPEGMKRVCSTDSKHKFYNNLDVPTTEGEEDTWTYGEYEVEKIVPLEGGIRLSQLDNSNTYGGGPRIDRVQIGNLGKQSYVEYTYHDGITSYEPYKMNTELDPYTSELSSCLEEAKEEALSYFKDNYFAQLYGNHFDLFNNANFLPGPGVTYKSVDIKSGVIDENGENEYASGYLKYEFENNIVPYIETNIPSYDPKTGAVPIGSPHANIVSAVSLYRKLKKQKNLNLSNDQVLSETETFYSLKSDMTLNEYVEFLELNHDGIGIYDEYAQEDFNIYDTELIREYYNGASKLTSKFRDLPVFKIGESSVDYTTGETVTVDYMEFDSFTGQVIKTKTTDGYGNTFVSETVPAYHRYGGMGLAINGGKNMLTQTAASYTWKVNPSDIENKQALVAADIQTWNNKWAYRGVDGTQSNNAANDQYRVWRKHRSYSYTANTLNTRVDTDGLVAFDPTTFEDFDSWDPDDDAPGIEWQKNAEITLYDRYSHALEATDVNGNFAATKMDSQQEKVLSTVANASYNELAYSGAEDALSGSYFGGAVSKGDATLYTAADLGDAKVHTGYASLSAASGEKAFGFEATATADRRMKVSVWSNKNDGVLKFIKNGGTETSFANISSKRVGAGGWYLLTATVAVNDGDQLEAWCEAGSNGTYFDDFRVHPIDAPMTAYVYNAHEELAYVLDNNNLFTEYQYDDMGRLKSTYRESFKYGRKKVSEYAVHYSKEPTSNK